MSLVLFPPPDHREKQIATPDTKLVSCTDFKCESLEEGSSLKKHLDQVKMHMNPEDTSECFNCCNEFDSIVKHSANLVLCFKEVIGGTFRNVTACYEICKYKK